MDERWERFYQELEEYLYVMQNYQVSDNLFNGLDANKHTTVIFVYVNGRAALAGLHSFCHNLYGKGVITHSQAKVEIDGITFLFKSEKELYKGLLRGYDKRKTIIINRGGLQ